MSIDALRNTLGKARKKLPNQLQPTNPKIGNPISLDPRERTGFENPTQPSGNPMETIKNKIQPIGQPGGSINLLDMIKSQAQQMKPGGPISLDPRERGGFGQQTQQLTNKVNDVKSQLMPTGNVDMMRQMLQSKVGQAPIQLDPRERGGFSAFGEITPGGQTPQSVLRSSLGQVNPNNTMQALSTGAPNQVQTMSASNTQQTDGAKNFFGSEADIRLAKEAGIDGNFYDVTNLKGDELYNLLSQGGTVLGGEAAGIDANEWNQAISNGANLQRVSGHDRFDTLNALKQSLGMDNTYGYDEALPTYYGNAADIQMAKQAGVQGNFVDVGDLEGTALLEQLIKGGVVLGGAGGAISEDEWNRAIEKGADLTRIGGKDRYETLDKLKGYSQQYQNNHKQNQYQDKITDLEELLKNPFEYDPENDPIYQSAKTLAEKQAAAASKSAMETMNDRGILNSSMTSNQLGQIEQGAQQNVLNLIPQLAANARQDQQFQINQQADLLRQLMGDSWNERQFQEDLRRWNEESQMKQDQTDWQKETWQKEFDFDKQKWADQYNMERDKWEFTKDQQAIDNALKQRGLDMEAARIDISRMNAMTDIDYKSYLMDMGLSEQEGKQATNSFIAGLSGAKSREDALAMIASRSSELSASGANVSQILDAIDSMYGTGTSDVLTGKYDYNGMLGGPAGPPK